MPLSGALAVVVCAWATLADAAPAGFTITDDRFEPMVTVTGPELTTKDGDDEISVRLRSWVDKKTGSVAHQVYIVVSYVGAGWRTYDIAYDDQGSAHAVKVIKRESLKCDEGAFEDRCRSETLGVDITDDQLRSYAARRTEFKIKSKAGADDIISLGATLPTEQFSALNPYVRTPYPIDASRLPPPDLGVMVTDYGGFNRRLYFGLDRGLQILLVNEGSVAANAGLKRGDWILDLGGEPMKTERDLKAALAKAPRGAPVPATIRHSGQIKTINLQF